MIVHYMLSLFHNTNQLKPNQMNAITPKPTDQIRRTNFAQVCAMLIFTGAIICLVISSIQNL